MVLDIIGDLPAISGRLIYRRPVAAVAGAVDPKPLIAGTESYAYPWLASWHRNQHNWAACDVACYSILDAVVSGAGNVWIGDRLITSPEVMPPYVAHELGIATGGNEMLSLEKSYPIRVLERPCLVAVGHGIRVYGHFLIEMLFRILVARRAFQGSRLRYGILLDQSAPPWLLNILERDLGIPASEIEFFDSKRERVRLRHAIVPGRVFIGDRVHPVANDLLSDLLSDLALSTSSVRRVFVTRGRFRNPAAPNRICVNEGVLVGIAADYGFMPVAPEDLSWREQIALFRDADIIIGQAGSGLHTALFSQPGSRLASIGFMNLVQAEIGALRRLEMAFLCTGKIAGDFQVNERDFASFVQAVASIDPPTVQAD